MPRSERTRGDQGPIAVLVALEVEAGALLRGLKQSSRSSPGLAIWTGAVGRTPVLLVITGVGKVAAALAAQFVADAFKPRGFMVVGLAGATESGAGPGDLIIASGALQHDFDARPLTDARGVIPGLGVAVFAADPELSERLRLAAESAAGDPRAVRAGVVLTGDQVITSRTTRDRLVAQFPGGACFDMETAAVAQVAHQNGIPWAALRVTSDAADEGFQLEDVVGFGQGTAAELFDKVVRAALSDL